MADGTIQLPPDSTGKILDTTSLTVGLNTVQRERMNIADPTAATGLAGVVNAVPGAADFGLETRPVYPLQASTTSGQGGPLVQGAVTTAAPTYVTAQTDPLSLTTTGALRVNDTQLVAQGSTTTAQTGPLIQAAVTTNAPAYVTGQTSPLSLSTAGALRTLAAVSTTQTSNSATAGDNKANGNSIVDNAGVANPLNVGLDNYGGAFSGTTQATLTGWSKARTATIFKTATINATATGNTAVWTPGSGNKFRLLGYQISAQGLAATATAAITVKFQDATTDIAIGTYDVDVPAVANVVSGVNQISGGPNNFGTFGVLSAAANNVLNFNISAAGAGTVGTYRATVWGTEE